VDRSLRPPISGVVSVLAHALWLTLGWCGGAPARDRSTPPVTQVELSIEPESEPGDIEMPSREAAPEGRPNAGPSASDPPRPAPRRAPAAFSSKLEDSPGTDLLDDPFAVWFANLQTGSRGLGGGQRDGASGTGGSGDGFGSRGGSDAGRARNRFGSAALSPHGQWDCDFPPHQRNDARVRMIVTVRADGSAEAVDIVSDPGRGFGQAARDCAMRQTFVPARDEDGHPQRSKTPEFTIHFID
jgi:protein TonB